MKGEIFAADVRNKNELPCTTAGVLKIDGKLFVIRQGCENESISWNEFRQNGFQILNDSIPYVEGSVLLQTSFNPLVLEFVPTANLEKRLQELYKEAIKKGIDAVAAQNNQETERWFWFAARANPCLTALVLLKSSLNGQISEGEMNCLERQIQEMMVV